ncbi:phasin family protein [Oleomonas cavernae]|uniref:Phasin family protein n=1 Tax=Oleomonas cavernae TaxID=2320859 RepID=A0A418WEX4_9PROT|nr:phasin family protein [Oleomonas cavernae]RJF88573.1 phasin family protein [Oleomonas cavernae]
MIDEPNTEFTPPFDAFEASQQIIEFWRQATNLPLTIAIEGLRFSARRLRAQADHLALLAGSGDATAVLKEQTAFVEQTLADYRDEATVVAKEIGDPIATLEEAA